MAKAYIPTVTLWNRVEGNPRAKDFSRALKAEIRDPLWMLSKQWQMGEFKGEDAGSAILAKVHLTTTRLNKYQAGDAAVEAWNEEVPAEVQVEHQSIAFQQGDQIIALDLRLLMGRHWLKLLKKAGFVLAADYLAIYAFEGPDPTSQDDALVCAHLESWQQFSAVARRKIDGYQLYQDLKQPGARATDKVAAPAGREDELNTLAERYLNWFEKLYFQPGENGNPSWKPSHLEHQFACSAPKGDTEKVLIGEEYYHGHLDWYNLDVHNNKTQLDEVNGGDPESKEDSMTLSFFPSPVTFAGMPHSRWWALEDWKTNLGSINPNTTDINQLMLLDFGLNYANDWFVLPFTVPVGSLIEVEGLMVTNVFGEKIWVKPAGEGNEQNWQRWGMFNLNTRGDLEVPADLSLLIPPAINKSLEGQPLEEVFMLRDEIANMVWGVESLITLPTGKSKAGKKAGLELRNKFKELTAIVPELPLAENDAKIRYQIVNTVLEQWIPFIPVHLPGSNRKIQLQRAAMPRILEGTDSTVAPKKIEPRTSLLRHGLDQSDKEGYYIHEEEVSRSGIRITKSYQRTRWFDGKVFTWLGIRKQTGRGAGHSGLTFDQILPVEKS